MYTFDKVMASALIIISIGTTLIGLASMHYNHLERLAEIDRSVQMARIEKMCIDD